MLTVSLIVGPGLPPGHPSPGAQFVRPNTGSANPSGAPELPHTNQQQTVPRQPPPPLPSVNPPQIRPGPTVPIAASVSPQNHSPQGAAPPPTPPPTTTQQHAVTLFQPVPQGHILTARVHGVCPPLAQNSPPLPLQAPHPEPQTNAAPSVTQGPQRLAFQNIAPKPTAGQQGAPAVTLAAAAAPASQQQSSMVIMGAGPQQSPAYAPTIHQIVLTNPSAIQITGQPAAASSPSHSNTQVPSNQTVSQALSIKRQQQQLQIISQTPPSQPTSAESSLIKQLLLPKRGPSTPGGKLILPAPQVPLPNSATAAVPQQQIIYQTSYTAATTVATTTAPPPQQLNVQLVPGPLGQLISTSGTGTAATTAIIQGPTTFTVVPNAGFATSVAPPPFTTATPQTQPPLRGDKIICQKEEEAKDATGLHVHERRIEVMENSSLASASPSNGTASNGDVAAAHSGGNAKLLNGRKCTAESNLPPYHSGNSQQGALNGPTNGKLESLTATPKPDGGGTTAADPKRTLVNGVCDSERGDRNIPNHIASKQHLGNGEVAPPPPTPPSQQDTAKVQQGERLPNGPLATAAGGKPPSELTNGPLAAPILRQQLLPNSTLPSTISLTSQGAANGLTSEPRGLKRPAENEERSAAAAAPSGIPNKVGVRIITISDPNNAGSSATMVAVPAGTDPSTVAKVAIENAAQQRNCSPVQAVISPVSVLLALSSSFYNVYL